MKRVHRDNAAIIRAMSAPNGHPQGPAAVTSDPHDRTVDPGDPAGEQAYRASLTGLNVPAPLVDRLFADRQSVIRGLEGPAAQGAAIDVTLQRLRADGIRTGAIHPGDTTDLAVSGEIAGFRHVSVHF
jgi:hypothetical protein